MISKEEKPFNVNYGDLNLLDLNFIVSNRMT